MANTGLNQATVAYKVRAVDNAPLDIDGNPTSESGKRQAIAILTGTTNPNPALYEVEQTFVIRAVIAGVPTFEYSEACIAGYIYLNPAQPDGVILTTAAPSVTFNVVSGANWYAVGFAGITITPANGPRMSTPVTITRSGNGSGIVEFINSVSGQKVSLQITSVATAEWILANGTWNMANLWLNNGLWNY